MVSFSVKLFCFYRFGEFVDDYEKKKVEMQKVEEEISFNYYKKKVFKLLFVGKYMQYVILLQ